MNARILGLCLVLCLPLMVPLCPAQETAAGVLAAKTAGWDDAWSMGNALAVKNCVDQLFYPHAIALLEAERKLKAGTPAIDILQKLKSLPGIKGVVVSAKEEVQWPDNLVKMDAFDLIVFNSRTSESKAVAPMMHRTVGGAVRSQQIPMGDDILDLLIRYVQSDTFPVATAALALVMDKSWLMAQIPAVMDSLYRENSQLLFCAASPTNHIWEQSLGVVTKTDTLWWIGRKDVKIANMQPLWPFSGLEVCSYVHTLETK